MIEVAITSINDDGFGVSCHENTPILIAGALPGESIRAKVTYVGEGKPSPAFGRSSNLRPTGWYIHVATEVRATVARF
ncbi:hypothetical protein [Geotalea toluenoxydans]|uniref:hypothetical protein n=1 Tax=Geotalea toluenoxydans TaxID=421624 RepID=UPI001FB4647E|nr:hypothetical protein [Geotalea toluenoxydans]